MPCKRVAQVVAALLVFGATAAWSVEAPLKYQRHEAWSIFVLRLAEPPPGDWKLPKFNAPAPAYLLLSLGETRTLMVLDVDRADAKFYNLLYCDANGNHDLTDDPPVKSGGIRAAGDFLAPGNFRAASFNGVPLSVREGGRRLTRQLSLTANCQKQGDKLLDKQEVLLNLSVDAATAQANPENELMLPGYGSLNTVARRPEGYVLPKFTDSAPQFGFLEIGAEPRLLALDRRGAHDTHPNRLYFDANGNKDLTDDPVIDGNVTSYATSYASLEFPAIDTVVKRGAARHPYRFQLNGYIWGGGKGAGSSLGSGSGTNLHYEVQCSYAGEVALDGRKYRLTLSDSNGNGSFSDRMRVSLISMLAGQIHANGDRVYISAADDESFNADGLVFGDWLLAGDRLHQVAVKWSADDENNARATLALTPVTENLHPLTFATAPERLSLYCAGAGGVRGMMVVDAKREVRVPAGEYGLLDYTIQRKDEQGDLWRISAAARTAGQRTKVGEASGATLAFGEPFTPNIQARPFGSKVSLSFDLHGSGGEAVNDIRHVSGGKTKIAMSKSDASRPKEPTYRIVKEDGEVAASGAFEYG